MANSTTPEKQKQVILRPWHEHKAPLEIPTDEMCATLHARKPYRFVYGEGNPEGSLAIILDNPGARENASGEQYVCGTRETLRKALDQAGIEENQVYVAFLYKCRPWGKYSRDEANKIFLPILKDQIRQTARNCLVALGDTVCKALYGQDSTAKSLRGLALQWLEIPLVAGYHPLAARRRPNLFPLLVEDFQAARLFLKPVRGPR